ECAGDAVVRRLERLPPPHFDLWVVPDLNPDGRAVESRTDARGVDLNRNFRGPRSFSERETRFAGSLIRRLRPAVTICSTSTRTACADGAEASRRRARMRASPG